MIKILIVEDEVFVRKCLKNAIQNADADFNIVAEAGNGKQALEMFETQAFDLILTDIAMPIMDGMEFIEKVREKDTNIKIIVLSCLSDFEYAKKALNYRVHDYFLKAETDPSELIVKLNEVKALIIKEKLSGYEESNAKWILNHNIYEIQEKFLRMLLWGPQMTDNEIEKKIKELNLPLFSQNLFVASMMLDNLKDIKQKSTTKELELIDFSILNIFREILDKDNSGSVFTKSNGHYIVIICFKGVNSNAKIMDTLNRLFSFFFEQIKKFFSITITAGISTSYNDFDQLSNAYNQSISAYNQRFFLGKGILLIYDDLFTKIHNKEEAISIDRGLLLTSLQNRNLMQLKKDVKSLLNTMETHGFSEKCIRSTAMAIILFISEKVFELVGSNNKIYMSHFEITNEINSLDTFNELKDWIILNLEALYNFYEDKKSSTPSKDIVEKIKEYIDENYSRNINLNVVANHFDMNHCYISLIFKEKTGENFIDYLTEIRIQKAKLLICDSTLSIQDIGEQVGYPNPQYFSKVFKKATGMSPSEYKTN